MPDIKTANDTYIVYTKEDISKKDICLWEQVKCSGAHEKIPSGARAYFIQTYTKNGLTFSTDIKGDIV